MQVVVRKDFVLRCILRDMYLDIIRKSSLEPNEKKEK